MSPGGTRGPAPVAPPPSPWLPAPLRLLVTRAAGSPWPQLNSSSEAGLLVVSRPCGGWGTSKGEAAPASPWTRRTVCNSRCCPERSPESPRPRAPLLAGFTMSAAPTSPLQAHIPGPQRWPRPPHPPDTHRPPTSSCSLPRATYTDALFKTAAPSRPYLALFPAGYRSPSNIPSLIC